MLKLFEVEGFKNFKDKITFDFSDVRDYKFNTECISNGLLGKSIVYGKNSVGKTNLGLAMFDIVSHLTSNHFDFGLYDYYLNANIFPEIDNEAALFHYIFSFDDNEIDYEYTKNKECFLIYERVVINNKLMYEYNYYNKSGNLDALKDFAPTLDMSMQDVESILKYVVNNTILPKDHLLRRMIRFVSNMLWFRNSNHNKYIGYKTQNKDYYNFMFADDNLIEFEDLLHASGVDGKLMALKDIDGIERLYFKALTPLPFFFQSLQAEQERFILSSIGTKPPLMCR